jgi:hypothetical protein
LNLCVPVGHGTGVRWLVELFFEKSGPPPPVLLRVAEPGGSTADAVDVEATWSPSGRRAVRAHRTAAGLCVIPWLGDEDRVHLEVRSETGAVALEIARDRLDGGRVQDVRLTPRSSFPARAL